MGGKYKVVPGYVLTRLGNGCSSEWERTVYRFRAKQGEVKSGLVLRVFKAVLPFGLAKINLGRNAFSLHIFMNLYEKKC